MKKDDDGDIILDKSEFTLANLIYVNRKFGKHKTGLQERRERFEKNEKDRKLAEAIENAKILEQKEEENRIKKIKEKEEEINGNVVKAENLIGDKDDLDGPTEVEDATNDDQTLDENPASVSTIAESVTESQTSSNLNDNTNNKENNTQDNEPKRKELTAEEITRRNRAALTSLNIRTNEHGEMMVDSQQTISYPGKDDDMYNWLVGVWNETKVSEKKILFFFLNSTFSFDHSIFV